MLLKPARAIGAAAVIAAGELAKLRSELRDIKVSLVRWMFTFWIGTALAVAGSRLVLQ